MAKCKECGEKINWAVVKNGTDAGKNRPFDDKGGQEGGLYQYALSDSGQLDKYERPVLEARFYDDPVEGMENNEVLYRNHFKSCSEKGNYKGGKKSSGGKDAYVTFEANGVRYAGTIPPVFGEGNGSAEEEAF